MTATLPMAVIKIGGSVATTDRDSDRVNRELLARLANALATTRAPIALVHGTGRVGKPWAHRGGFAATGRLPRESRDVALRIKAELRALNAGVVAALIDGGLPAFGLDYESFLRLGRDAAGTFLRERIELGVVPVFFGDMLPSDDGGFEVVSSDTMLERIVETLSARTAIFLTDVPGVLGGVPEALLREITPATLATAARRESDEHDVSAGMRGKLACAFRVAARTDRCFIASGLDETIAARLVAGEDAPSTRIVAAP